MTITARHITKQHGKETILSRLDLDFEPGQACALVGVNGAGKSTLLSMLAGLITPDAGLITYGENALSRMMAREIATIRAFMAQSTEPVFDYSTLEVVMMGEHARSSRLGLPTRSQRQRAMRLLERVELAHRATHPITSLSGGERQRAMFARALATQTPWLLLDEPTASLDIRHSLQTMHIIREHCHAGGGAIVVAHDLGLVERFFDRVVVIHCGEIIADGPPQDALTRGLLSSIYRTPMTSVRAGHSRLWYALEQE